ncbi:hypothetical protein BKA82DRAFT_25625 [Pisolithus tinctorius]|uniref:Uncharacterized protein n=1 Tax=Pisolithus tinctorius Marx 270 TaxID=870435 RepID=A0A0C3PBE3_PISTI|nr:hypothetical protein BKA82DRAFT_25625 [Pisolithus tinctorius]KIO05004.1 hypothetical protein M404DRAFT_25625 [Pisolithus tinctorius Marx 270]
MALQSLKIVVIWRTQVPPLVPCLHTFSLSFTAQEPLQLQLPLSSAAATSDTSSSSSGLMEQLLFSTAAFSGFQDAIAALQDEVEKTHVPNN